MDLIYTLKTLPRYFTTTIAFFPNKRDWLHGSNDITTSYCKLYPQIDHFNFNPLSCNIFWSPSISKLDFPVSNLLYSSIEDLQVFFSSYVKPTRQGSYGPVLYLRQNVAKLFLASYFDYLTLPESVAMVNSVRNLTIVGRKWLTHKTRLYRLLHNQCTLTCMFNDFNHPS